METVLFPFLIMVCPLVLLFPLYYAMQFYQARKKRKTPLTANLLRYPGESLRNRIDDISEDLTFYISFMPAVPLFLYATHISQSYFSGTPETSGRLLVSVMAALLLLGFALFRVHRLLNLRRRFRLAHDAEMSAGQELNQLMLKGYHVFHDFPAEKFNIDHIVVGPTGVFAVETKARLKGMNGKGQVEAKMEYDGKCLQFPGWTEKKPLSQANDQAEWLKKWLGSAVGEEVFVKPALVLPGWYVKRTGPGGIVVLNPKQFPSLLQMKRPMLSEEQIQRVVHQLDQRCRTVEPKAYAGEVRKF